ncbi:XLF family protein [Purpureocillium lavendulum]|uniref:Non-homologous end-joining factor 1 n=1 Tax=Purpureocillium lavendulum TaxID=1247861 RepID=A0AB34FWP8_9HYPO|nr:XLF family protein [Purpureocillium lavendulum]
MSATNPTWRPLPLASATLPVLLVSAVMGTASYSIRLTDMANLWTETLERKDICMRGWNENTSIDPSDTPENMAKFLASLQSALDKSQPGHENTSISLSPDMDSSGNDSLTLKLTCDLPGFKPLKWPVRLKKSPCSSLATDLVVPLVQAHYSRKREVESLMQALAQKDAVLNRLLDKLDAMGTGLEHVFTALSGRKKVTRAAAEDKVRGLAPFKEKQWKAALDNDSDGPANVADLVQSVFDTSGLLYKSTMDIDKSPELDNWWHHFQATSQLAHRQQVEAISPPTTTQSPPRKSTSVAPDEDDDFQVQATPPHLRSGDKSKATKAASIPDDASTESDDDDDDVAIPDSNPPATGTRASQHSDVKKAPSRLGAIGGKTQKRPSPSPPPDIKATSTGAHAVDDSETASEAENDTGKGSARGRSPTPPRPARASGPKKAGLGKIGGRVSAQTADREVTPEEAAPKPTEKVSTPKKVGGLGRIGGGPSPKDGTVRGRDSTRMEPEPKEQRRETSQERADRRREELKRELERKAAAGPAKKKRRF